MSQAFLSPKHVAQEFEAGSDSSINAPSIPQSIIFDICFGTVMPLICVLVDPIVFRGYDVSRLLRWDLHLFALPAYLIIGSQIIAMSLWLVTHRFGELLGGFMAFGAVFSLVLGLILAPLSIMGVTLGIGLLGFTPFLTAHVFYRHCRQALATAAGLRGAILVLIGLLLACLPAAAIVPE